MLVSSRQKILISALFAFALTACGGGGGSNVAAAKNTAFAYSSYLVNATVICDANSNGALDAGEQTTTTDNQGHFTFSPECTSDLAVTGGIVSSGSTVIAAKGASNNFPFNQVLRAPAGSKMISPLTHLLLGLMRGADGIALTPDDLSQRDAAALMAKVLNLSGNILTRDAVQMASNGNVGMLKKSLVVQQLTKMQQSIDYDVAVALCQINDSNKTLAQCQNENSGVAKLSVDAAFSALLPRFLIPNLPALFSGVYLQSAAIDLFMNTNAGAGSEYYVYRGLFNDATASLLRALTLDDLDRELIGQISRPNNYLYLANDRVTIHQTSINVKTRTDFLDLSRGVDLYYEQCQDQGSPLTGIYPKEIRFTLGHRGNLSAAVPGSSSAMLINLDEITDRFDTAARKLQVMVDKVNFTNNGGELRATIPDDAKVYIYGKNTNGSAFNIQLGKSGASFLTASNSLVRIDYEALITKLKTLSQLIRPDIDFSELEQLIGNFEVTVVVQNLTVLFDNGQSLPVFTAGVHGAVDAATNSPVPAISGYGIHGRINFMDIKFSPPAGSTTCL